MPTAAFAPDPARRPASGCRSTSEAREAKEADPGCNELAALASKLMRMPFVAVYAVTDGQPLSTGVFPRMHQAKGCDAGAADAARLAALVAEAGELLVVENARTDARFATRSATKPMAFGAGAPLLDPEGQIVGVICLLDHQPRTLGEEERESLRMLANQASRLLDLRRERRESEERKTELERLELVVSTTDAMVIVTDAELRVTYANPSFERISGYSPAEAIGGRPGELLSGPRTDPNTIAWMRDRLAAGEGFEVEVENHHKDGHTYWMEAEFRPVRDAAGKLTKFIGVGRDITRQRHTLDLLRQSEDRFNRMTSNLPGMVYTFEAPRGENGRFTFVSDAARGLYGLDPSEILADPAALLSRTHPDDLHQVFRAIRQSSADGSSLHTTVRHLPRLNHADDTCPIDAALETRWLSVSARSASDGAGGTITDGVVIDVTCEMLAKQRLQAAREEADAAKREAERAAKRAEEANKSKGRFLANVSHEIRTPLNGVIGLTDLLMRRPLDHQQKSHARLIKSSAHSLLTLINDILDVSKIEARKLELSPIDFQPREVVADAVQMLCHAASTKGLQLACHVESGVPARLHGDADRLRQVLVNLLNNAIKFTEAGDVLLHVAATEPDAQGRKSGLRVEITDTGIGVPSNRLHRLFQSFSQVDASTTRRFGGTGLGLAICKELVTLMGGRIGVRTEPGVGSTFWFTVAMPEAKSPPAAPLRGGFKGLRVLVVDDHPASLVSLAEPLTEWGFDVSHATSAAAALRQAGVASQNNQPFEFALLGLSRTAENLELGSALESHLAGDQKPRLFFLGAAGHEIRAQHLAERGFQGSMLKPVRQSELFDALATASRRPRAEPRVAPETLPTIPSEPVGADAADSVPTRRRGRVLLAEDNAVNQLIATELLHAAGLEVCAVRTGVEALAALQSAAGGQKPEQLQERAPAEAGAAFDLVLMDCQMPDMDGLQATREWRRREAAASTPAHAARRMPIVALTASAIHGDRERCLAAGMDGYVCKPIDPDQLLAQIDAHIDANIPAPKGSKEAELSQSGPRLVHPATLEADAQPGGAEPTPTPAAEAINLPTLLARCGGKQALVARLLEGFAGGLDQQINDIDSAASSGDHAALARLAHTVKGSAANLSAESLARAASDMERCSLAGEAHRVAEGMPPLRQAAEACRREAIGLVERLQDAA